MGGWALVSHFKAPYRRVRSVLVRKEKMRRKIELPIRHFFTTFSFSALHFSCPCPYHARQKSRRKGDKKLFFSRPPSIQRDQSMGNLLLLFGSEEEKSLLLPSPPLSKKEAGLEKKASKLAAASVEGGGGGRPDRLVQHKQKGSLLLPPLLL